MPDKIVIDQAVFSKAAISEETARFNAELQAKLEALPDQWSFPAALVRERRAQGLGPFPVSPRSKRARTLTIAGRGGPLPLRIIAPENPSGILLHFHGGGWMLGSAEEQDNRLDRIVDNTGYAVVSVDYRLAPEHPYPAAPDDCETAAVWLIDEGAALLGSERLAIGGESAGAHLAAVTLLRLRDRHGLAPFSGAVLIAGCYDLAMTPSACNWGPAKLVLNSRDICRFIDAFLGETGAVIDPDVSPLRADLGGLPRALFTVGTADPLVDDTLFMAARWLAAGNRVEMSLWPGGCHVFQNFPSAMTEASLATIDNFLNRL